MKSKIMKMMVAALALASFGLMGCEEKESVKDADGNVYPAAKIGDQIWMAKNLNVNVPGSMCYDNKPENCEKYGRLYTWGAAKSACPAGWRLPSRGEFETLLATVGDSVGNQSKNLRAGSWENGANKFGFSALPAGYYGGDYDWKFYDVGRYASFWSSTEKFGGRAYNLNIFDGSASVNYFFKYRGHSVRCLKDN